jgi:Nif-specific regulatory protein
MFEFAALLTDHPPIRAWQAVDKRTGTACFVKQFMTNGADSSERVVELAAESFRRQSRIHTRSIVTAIEQIQDNGSLLVAYPYLDPAMWRRLCPSMFAADWREILSGISLIVDYLHSLDLVHGDLKLDNFVIRHSSDGVDIRLIDLDFLSDHNTKPNALLFGTPDHIPPELLANERVVIQSDLYSLGVSLRRTLECLSQNAGEGQDEAATCLKACGSLLDDLTQGDFLARPVSMLEAMHRHGLIAEDQLCRLNWRLLAMLTATSLRSRSDRRLLCDRFGHWLVSRMGVLGVPSELVEASATAYRRSPARTWRVFRSLPSCSSLTRQGKYWQLCLSDQGMARLLRDLDHIRSTDQAMPVIESLPDLLTLAEQYNQQAKPLRAFLLLENTANALEEKHATVPAPDLVKLHAALGRTAAKLNRQRTALAHFSAALALTDGQEFYDLAGDAVNAAIRSGDLEKGRSYLEEATTRSDYPKNSETDLRFQRYEAWLLQSTGRLDEAEQLLTSVLSRARELEVWELAVTATYMLGVVALRRGDYPRCVRELECSLDLIRKHRPLAKDAPIQSLIVLAFAYGEMAQYEKVLRYGKAAYRLGLSCGEISSSTSACMSVVVACVRLAEFSKAQFWLQRYWELAAVDPQVRSISGYQMMVGFLRLQECRLVDAEHCLFETLGFSRDGSDKRFALKARQGLAELALWRGNVSGCLEHIQFARRIATELHEGSTIVELQLLDVLSRASTELSDDRSHLFDVAVRLVEANCRYYAMLAAYHLRLRSLPLPASILSLIEELQNDRGSSTVPLFTAIFSVYRPEPAPGSWDFNELAGWKTAYTTLARGRQLFLAALTALHIADRYSTKGYGKHARKYYLQARRHAEALSNTNLLGTIDIRLAGLLELTDRQAPIIDSFFAISELLKDLKQYRATLNGLVKFAVTQTGAERGILFLKSPDKGTLQVAASFNCDEESLTDLIEFSANIPKASAEDLAPFIIDNALEDRRTNQFQSVVRHNILSVACLPLFHEARLVGVLYLDHHGIPALFASEDLQFLKVISNLLIVAISATKEIRTLANQTTTLNSELSKIGARGALITQNETMHAMLDKLPLIARSSASVLLLGESGTGKEILCDMLHSMSSRAREPLVKVNCAGFAPTLVEAELFGIARGVATGVMEREGKFEAADGGTLFLDEIADMPLDVQAKILRVIEYQQFERVGSQRSVRVDVRFIFATHQNLRKLVHEGRFRSDLYYRINTVTIEVPPLRQRRDDIIPLIEHFVKIHAAGMLPPRFSQDTLNLFVGHSWKGNVRQLRHVVEFCCLFHPGENVTANMLPREFLDEGMDFQQDRNAVEAAERARLAEAIHSCHGNQSRAAENLGIPLATFRRKLKKFGLWPSK